MEQQTGVAASTTHIDSPLARALRDTARACSDFVQMTEQGQVSPSELADAARGLSTKAALLAGYAHQATHR